MLQLIEAYSFLVKQEELRARVCFDSGCRTVGYAIPPQNQLVMRKILKSFMVFDIIPHGPIFRVVVGSQIVIPQQSLPRNDTPVTRTHDLGFDTIFRTVRCAIPPQNQLVMRKIHSNLLWNLTSHHVGLFLKWL